jgi:integrative and conjugative element protein (TIGR02256 family)
MRGLQRRPIATAWISRSALEAMFSEADRAYPRETGGVLMGYWAVPYSEVVITQAVGPGPNAYHKRFSFTPDHEFHDSQIAQIYKESGRMHAYLGDWHSHPAAVAYLSKLDGQTLKRIAAYVPARAQVPLMAILGAGTPWEIRIWRYLRPELFRLRGPRTELLCWKPYFPSKATG